MPPAALPGRARRIRDARRHVARRFRFDTGFLHETQVAEPVDEPELPRAQRDAVLMLGPHLLSIPRLNSPRLPADLNRDRTYMTTESEIERLRWQAAKTVSCEAELGIRANLDGQELR
jgi:hypothetical protein